MTRRSAVTRKSAVTRRAHDDECRDDKREILADVTRGTVTRSTVTRRTVTRREKD